MTHPFIKIVRKNIWVTRSTIAERRAKSCAIISDIIQILDVILDERGRTKKGLSLRRSWIVNAIFVKVEL